MKLRNAVALSLLTVFGCEYGSNTISIPYTYAAKDKYKVNEADAKKVVKALQDYANNNEADAMYQKAELKDGKLIILLDKDALTGVAISGERAYLQNTYKQVNKFQDKYHTKMPMVFKDSELGKVAWTKYNGKGHLIDVTDGSNDHWSEDFKNGDSSEME